MHLDVTQALKDAENALRDFIAYTLSRIHGPNWPDKCGLDPDRIAEWRKRKATEEKGGASDERLIYYANFPELAPILRENWEHFSEGLGADLTRIELFLSELKKLRNPDAHRRELLPHQKALACGISGEIRSLIVRYRSKRETADDCFPRIESARDNLGTVFVADGLHLLPTSTVHVGDVVDFVVTASD